jgi:hypothetical protein
MESEMKQAYTPLTIREQLDTLLDDIHAAPLIHKQVSAVAEFVREGSTYNLSRLGLTVARA